MCCYMNFLIPWCVEPGCGSPERFAHIFDVLVSITEALLVDIPAWYLRAGALLKAARSLIAEYPKQSAGDAFADYVRTSGSYECSAEYRSLEMYR